MTIGERSYSKSTNVKKMPKKLKIFSLEIHKDGGIFKSSRNLSK